MSTFQEMKAAAQGRWAEIWAALGVPDLPPPGQHGPCPGCGGRDRFRLVPEDAEHGGWICGQGGNPTGGDGLELLCHVHGWKKGEALKVVAGYLGILPDTSPQARQQARERAIQAKRHRYEEALVHELTVLRLAISRRVVDRDLVKDRHHRANAPQFRPMPDEHWQREIQAALRITALIGKLYPTHTKDKAA